MIVWNTAPNHRNGCWCVFRCWVGVVYQPNLYLSRQARVYNCLVGPGTNAMDSGSTAPTVLPNPLHCRRNIVWGAKAKPPAFPLFSPAALLCNARVARKCVMSGRVNWSRLASRNRMRRQGVEDINGKMPLFAEPPKKPRRKKLSKAELREQAAAAFLAWRAGQTSKNK